MSIGEWCDNGGLRRGVGTVHMQTQGVAQS